MVKNEFVYLYIKYFSLIEAQQSPGSLHSVSKSVGFAKSLQKAISGISDISEDIFFLIYPQL